MTQVSSTPDRSVPRHKDANCAVSSPLVPGDAVGHTGVLVLVFVLAMSACGGSEQRSCAEYEFDRAAWDAGPSEDDEGPRVEQAEMLDRCRTLIGMTRAEVRALLGPAPPGTPRNLWIYRTGQTWFEEVGLSIELRNGRVVVATAGPG